MLVASCSDDNNGLDDEGGISQPSDGKAYVQFSIKLPTVSGSAPFANNKKTKANDVFEDGVAKEYAVNRATLIVFSGKSTDEDNAVVVQKSDLPLKPWNNVGSNDDQVTSEAKIVAEITGKEIMENDSLFALIVLNATDIVWNKFNTATETSSATTFKDLYSSQLVQPADMGGIETGFVMMNAPLAIDKTVGSGTTKIARTLVPIEKTYTSAAKAAAAEEPCEIYVERGVAKVSLTVDIPTDGNKVTNEIKTGIVNSIVKENVTISVANWILDRTNKTSYVMHNVSDFDGKWKDYGTKSSTSDASGQSRFYGTNSVGSGDYYGSATRIYWAKDPNYTGDMKVYTSCPFDTISTADYQKENSTLLPTIDDEAVVEKAVFYPLENTFNTEWMDENHTTRVIIKGVIMSDATNTKLSEQPTLYRVGSDPKLYDLDNLKTVITHVCKSVLPEGTAEVKFIADDQLSFTKQGGLKDINVADFNANVENYTNPVTSDNIEAIQNALGKINTFYKGECFYKVLIKHFGDDLTHWEPGDETYGNDGEKNWLGRYGIVRNNWYKLSVTGITTVGTSTIPDTPGTPDDQNKSYINVTCKILSWAVRNQNVTL